MVDPLKVYTWGYYGWGRAARLFVESVDWLEKRQGRSSAFFVDLRIRRAVRAANFKEKAFETIVGPSRHRWMRTLGNQRIVSHKGARIQIADPTSVEELLDLVIEMGRQNRRILMFCACLGAALIDDDGQPQCHRVAVASLLLTAAKRREMKLEVAEWPGTPPTTHQLEVADETLKQLVRTPQYDGDRYVRRFFKVGDHGSIPQELKTLGWGSPVELVSPDDRQFIVSGPAYWRSEQWKLEVLEGPIEGARAGAKAAKLGMKFLAGGYGPRRSME